MDVMEHTFKSVDILKDLIAFPSVTPDDFGCQAYLISKLESLGFKTENMKFKDINNFWATFGSVGPIFIFAGHTDVVPPGLDVNWQSNPFKAEVRDNKLFGRGASDMKGSIAAMLSATKRFLNLFPIPAFQIGFVITGDEEGEAKNGTLKIVDWLISEEIKPHWCLVGEPTSNLSFGDTIKVGRRGSITANVTIKGIQGHVAYPDQAINPIHEITPLLSEFIKEKWDHGNQHFPPTSLQIVNINAGANAANVIPGEVSLQFNLRFSPELSARKVKSLIIKKLNKHNLNFSILWDHNADPFYSEPGLLASKLRDILSKQINTLPKYCTGGGTSDGRFLKKLGCEVIEFGPTNKSIHKVDEHLDLVELSKLEDVYFNLLCELQKHQK